jgi:hypothetical protein
MEQPVPLYDDSYLEYEKVLVEGTE